MENEKECPFRMTNNYLYNCIGKNCMWWREYAKDCAIPLLADMFADSEICRSVFEQNKTDI